ncbi:heme exporter protein CcmD [Aquabacterium soli]|nr:heme exporter protein CcmD [Aquabacterium soli]
MTAMNWNSWRDLIAMGGHGLYVWGSLGMVLAVIAAEQIALAARRRAAIRAIQARHPDRRQHGATATKETA